MSAKFWHRLSHECDLWKQGLSLVAGVDEAGCAPLAGPVMAAAVVFPSAWLQSGLFSKLRGLNDSKQLSPEEREKFYARIIAHPEIRYAIASMDVETIDRINIRQAAWRAMNLALDQLQPRPDHVLVEVADAPVLIGVPAGARVPSTRALPPKPAVALPRASRRRPP